MEGVAYEAERRPGYCRHVPDPKPPKMLFGCMPSEAVRIAAERAEQAVDGAGKKLRFDALVFLGGVASFPVKWDQIRKSEVEKKRLRVWLTCMVGFLKQHYGARLCYILLHLDESYPHIHWGAVPELQVDRQMKFSTLHPGRAAYERARSAGRDNSTGRSAYKQAMREWQDKVHLAAYAPVGIARVGPRRQRLSVSEHKARQQADAALARTLAAEQTLKAEWRKEIRAELTAEFADELAHWKQHCADLNTRLAAADREISELRARLTELECQRPTPEGNAR